MSQVKVKNFVFELLGGKMCLTVMTLGNSKLCHLKQIFISFEFSRYQGSTLFIKESKKKPVMTKDTENTTDILKRYLGS